MALVIEADVVATINVTVIHLVLIPKETIMTRPVGILNGGGKTRATIVHPNKINLAAGVPSNAAIMVRDAHLGINTVLKIGSNPGLMSTNVALSR